MENTQQLISKDLCLRFDDKSTANEVLKGYTGAVDTIGIIFKPTGNFILDEEGVETPEMQPIDGWHVNTRGPVLDKFKPYIITVNTPVRVWA
jgi:hypothetical protein